MDDTEIAHYRHETLSLYWDGAPLDTLAALAPKRQQQRVVGPGLGDEALSYLLSHALTLGAGRIARHHRRGRVAE